MDSIWNLSSSGPQPAGPGAPGAPAAPGTPGKKWSKSDFLTVHAGKWFHFLLPGTPAAPPDPAGPGGPAGPAGPPGPATPGTPGRPAAPAVPEPEMRGKMLVHYHLVNMETTCTLQMPASL